MLISYWADKERKVTVLKIVQLKEYLIKIFKIDRIQYLPKKVSLKCQLGFVGF